MLVVVDLLSYLVLVCSCIDFICDDLKIVMVQISRIQIRIACAITIIVDGVVIAAVVR